MIALCSVGAVFVGTAVGAGIHQKNYNEYNNLKTPYAMSKKYESYIGPLSSDGGIDFNQYVKYENINPINTKEFVTAITIIIKNWNNKAFWDKSPFSKSAFLQMDGWKSVDEMKAFQQSTTKLEYVQADQAVYITSLTFAVLSPIVIIGLAYLWVLRNKKYARLLSYKD